MIQFTASSATAFPIYPGSDECISRPTERSLGRDSPRVPREGGNLMRRVPLSVSVQQVVLDHIPGELCIAGKPGLSRMRAR